MSMLIIRLLPIIVKARYSGALPVPIDPISMGTLAILIRHRGRLTAMVIYYLYHNTKPLTITIIQAITLAIIHSGRAQLARVSHTSNNNKHHHRHK